MIKLLIVDDHPVVRRGVKEILEDETDLEITETDDGRAVLRLIKEQSFDLIVLDLDLPGKSGLDLLQEIKRDCPNLPVLILSIYPEEQFAVRVLRAGAAGFISKDSAPDDLVKLQGKFLKVASTSANAWLSSFSCTVGLTALLCRTRNYLIVNFRFCVC